MGSTLAREAAETPQLARHQIAANELMFAELGDRLRERPPAFVVTCARGSSDHAALYGKYLIETVVGRVVASVGPSIASTYRSKLTLDGALFLAVSQSGRSPDLLELARSARDAGALVVGMLNDIESPLAAACEIVLPIGAGEERAVAATKSCLLAKLGLLQLVAAWSNDAALRDAVVRAPDILASACELDWATPLARLGDPAVCSGFVVGRGIALGAAYEMALKLKETCALHAEGFSAAEVLHGPVALVGNGFPIVALAQADGTHTGTRAVVDKLVQLGGDVYSTMDVEGATRLPMVASSAPAVLAPLAQLQSFYLALPALARRRGIDADRPQHLAKVTETM